MACALRVSLWDSPSGGSLSSMPPSAGSQALYLFLHDGTNRVTHLGCCLDGALMSGAALALLASCPFLHICQVSACSGMPGSWGRCLFCDDRYCQTVFLHGRTSSCGSVLTDEQPSYSLFPAPQCCSLPSPWASPGPCPPHGGWIHTHVVGHFPDRWAAYDIGHSGQ